MGIPELVRHGRLYARAELIVAEIRLRAEARRYLLGAVAAAIALAGFALINLALFRALESVWGPVWTPLALGGMDLALAGLAGALAWHTKPGRELSIAENLRNTIASELDQSLRGSSLMGRFDGSTLPLLVPAVKLIIGALRHKPTSADK